MSCNRDNIIWPASEKAVKAGAKPWRIGFYSFDFYNEGDDDFDHEWDVEYNYSSFWFIAEGNTQQEVMDAYTRSNSNPGMWQSIEKREGSEEKHCQELDGMFEAAREVQRKQRQSNRYW